MAYSSIARQVSNTGYNYNVNRNTGSTNEYGLRVLEKLTSPNLNEIDIDRKNYEKLFPSTSFTTPVEWQIEDSLQQELYQALQSSGSAPNEYGSKMMLANLLQQNLGIPFDSALSMANTGAIQKNLGLQYEDNNAFEGMKNNFLYAYYSNKAGSAFGKYMTTMDEDYLKLYNEYSQQAFTYRTAEEGYGWLGDLAVAGANTLGSSFTTSIGGIAITGSATAIGALLGGAGGAALGFKVGDKLAKGYTLIDSGLSQAGSDFAELYNLADSNGVKLDLTDPTTRALFGLDALLMGTIEVVGMDWTPGYKQLTRALGPDTMRKAVAKTFTEAIRIGGVDFIEGIAGESMEEFAQGIVSDTFSNAIKLKSNKEKGTTFEFKGAGEIVSDASEAFAKAAKGMVLQSAVGSVFGLGMNSVKLSQAAKNQTISNVEKTGTIDRRYINQEIKGFETQTTSENNEDVQATSSEKIPTIKVALTEDGAVPATEGDAENLSKLDKKTSKKAYQVAFEKVDISSIPTETRQSTLNSIGLFANTSGVTDGNIVGYTNDGALVVENEEAIPQVKKALKALGFQYVPDSNSVVTSYEDDGQYYRIDILTKDAAQDKNVKKIFDWSILKMNRPLGHKLSETEFLRESEVQYAFRNLVSKTTGLDIETVNKWFDSDDDSINVELPDGVSWESLASAANFMPILSKISGRDTDDLLSDGNNTIRIITDADLTTGKDVFTGEEKTVLGGFSKDTESGENYYTIHLTKNAKADTIVHELMHIARALAPKEKLEGFREAYGAYDLWQSDIKVNEDGTYTFNDKVYADRSEVYRLANQNEERFVSDFFKYLATEEAPNEEIKTFFEALKRFIQEVLQKFSDKLSDSTVEAFEQLLNGDVNTDLSSNIDTAVELSKQTLYDEPIPEAETPIESLETEVPSETTEPTSQTEESTSQVEESRYEASSYDEDEDNGLDEFGNTLWALQDANTQRRIDADFEYTENLLKANSKNFDADGNHLAPNGQKSNLSYKQWVQVRTPAFKAWFGDWESDVDNSSKVVDSNGEPLVVYHGSINSFDTFAENENGIYFTDNKEAASSYGMHSEPYGVFLKANEPMTIDFEGSVDTEETESHYALETEAQNAQENGYDSVIAYNTFDGENELDQYIVFKANQIKSATDNNGDFSLDNDSILYQTDGGYNWQKGMSNRAVRAYENGEKPMSKWTNEALNEAIKWDSWCEDDKAIEILTTLPLEAKKELLRQSSWHHTGKFYDVTYFYEIKDLSEITAEDAQRYVDEFKQYKKDLKEYNKKLKSFKEEWQGKLKPNQKLEEEFRYPFIRTFGEDGFEIVEQRIVADFKKPYSPDLEHIEETSKNSNDETLFSLSPKAQEEYLKQRKQDIKYSVELIQNSPDMPGEFVRTEYLKPFAGEEWADNELAFRKYLKENPDLLDEAKKYETVDEYLDAMKLKKDPDAVKNEVEDDSDIPFNADDLDWENDADVQSYNLDRELEGEEQEEKTVKYNEFGEIEEEKEEEKEEPANNYYQRKTALPQTEEERQEELWYRRIFSYAHNKTSTERNREFALYWTSSEDKTLQLANAIKSRITLGAVEHKKSLRGSTYYRIYKAASYRGVSTKVLRLKDGVRPNTKRSTSEQIQEAQKLIIANPLPYRIAYSKASSDRAYVDQLYKGRFTVPNPTEAILAEDNSRIDSDLEYELNNLKEDASPKKKRGDKLADYRKTVKQLEQKLKDAQEDLSKQQIDAKDTISSLKTRLNRTLESETQLKAQLKEAQAEMDEIIERMGNMIEKEQDKKEALKEKLESQLKEAKQKTKDISKELTRANNEVKRLTFAIDAMRRRNEAREATAYRKHRIEQINNLAVFNSDVLDASFEDTFAWVRSVFNMPDSRKGLAGKISNLKSRIEAMELAGEDASFLREQLNSLRAERDQSAKKEPPMQLGLYLPQDYLVRLDNRQSMWTAEELDTLYQAVKLMRMDAKQMLSDKKEARSTSLNSKTYSFFRQTYNREAALNSNLEMSPLSLKEDLRENEKERAYKTGKLGEKLNSLNLMYGKIQRLARIIDGDKEGIAYDFFVRQAWFHQTNELNNIENRRGAIETKWKELGLKQTELAKAGFEGEKINGSKYKLTRDQMIGVYVYSKSELGYEKLTSPLGNGIKEEVVKAIIAALSEKEIAWGDTMLEEMDSNYSRIKDVYYNVWNRNLGKRDAYFPLVSTEKAAAGEVDFLCDDPVPDKKGKSYIEKGFTKEVNPNAIYALNLNATATWNKQMRKQEHFIAYGQWARDAQYLLGNGGMGDIIKQRYGNPTLTMIQKIVNGIISTNSGGGTLVDSLASSFISARGAAVIIGSISSTLKQFASFPAMFTGDTSIANWLKASPALWEINFEKFMQAHEELNADNYQNIREFIYANAPDIKNRRVDSEILRLLNRSFGNPVSVAIQNVNDKIATYTMDFVDRMVVERLWYGAYLTQFEKNVAEGMSEQEAHDEARFKASQFISETQNSNMRMDLSPIQIDAQQSTWLRLLSVFTNQAMNLANQVHFDVPLALRQKNWKRAIGVAASVVVSLAIESLITGKVLPRDGEDEDKYKERLVREIISQTLGTFDPIFLANAAEAIDGYSSGSLISLGSSLGEAIRTITDKDKGGVEKLLSVLQTAGEEAANGFAVPITMIKRPIKAIQEKNPGYLVNNEWGEIWESYR